MMEEFITIEPIKKKINQNINFEWWGYITLFYTFLFIFLHFLNGTTYTYYCTMQNEKK